MICVELGITSVGSRPVQVEAVETEHLLPRRAPMHLHGGLLHALIATNIKPVQSCPGHLCHCGPRIAAAGNILQYRLVKPSRRLIVLQIDNWLALNFYDISHSPHLEFGVD